MSAQPTRRARVRCSATGTRRVGLGSALRGLPWLAAGLSAVATVLALVPGGFEALVFDRAALGRGELWRLVTGHFVHWSTAQWAWDTVVFFAVAAACEARGRLRLLSAVLLASLAISAGVALFQPGLSRYAGLSGIDCTLCAWMALDWMRAQWRFGARRTALLGAGLALAFAGKIGFELVTGSALFAGELAPGVAPVPLAHLLGAGLGPLLAIPPTGPRR